MNKRRVLVGLAALFAFAGVIRAQVVLRVDFNERGFDPFTNTQSGFQSFLIGSADGSGIQTNSSTAVFGPISVTLSGNGTNPGYDDRRRAFPVDSGDFTEGLLLRDFVFSRSTVAGGGLNLQIDGLTASAVYQVTIWSYDDDSSGARVSDWYANGVLVRDNYVFNGGFANRPTNNIQYQFTFKVTASPSGRVLIEGRRDAASGSNLSVFINAFQIEVGVADPPVPSIMPLVDLYAGDNTVFRTQVGGTPPFTYQWLKNSAPVENATNDTMTVFNTQISDIGNYSVIVSNSAGAVTSAVVTLSAVLPVENLSSGIISHWPFDQASTTTPDVLTNHNDFFLSNMGPTNIVSGHSGNALAFDGVTQYVARVHTSSTGLPIYTYPAYSVALWVKGDFTGQNDRRVFAEGSTTNNATLFSIGTHSQGTDGTVDIYVRNNNNTISVDHRHSMQVAFDNTWHHIAWVDNNGYPSLYVDGVLDAGDFTYRRGLLTPNTTSVGGLLRANPGNFFGGQIDQVAVWRRSLTSAEVQQVFTSGPPEPLRIISIQVTAGNVTITFHTPSPAAAHHVEATADVTAPQWTEVANVLFNLNGNTMTAQFSVAQATQRFYRVTY
jgi:hypothetical protein